MIKSKSSFFLTINLIFFNNYAMYEPYGAFGCGEFCGEVECDYYDASYFQSQLHNYDFIKYQDRQSINDLHHQKSEQKPKISQEAQYNPERTSFLLTKIMLDLDVNEPENFKSIEEYKEKLKLFLKDSIEKNDIANIQLIYSLINKLDKIALKKDIKLEVKNIISELLNKNRTKIYIQILTYSMFFYSGLFIQKLLNSK